MLINDLTQLHEKCRTDIQQLQLNLTNYLFTTKRAFHTIRSSLKNRDNEEYDEDINNMCDYFMTSVTNIADIVRKVNLKILANNLEESFSQYFNNDTTIVPVKKLLNKSINTVIKQGQNAVEIDMNDEDDESSDFIINNDLDSLENVTSSDTCSSNPPETENSIIIDKANLNVNINGLKILDENLKTIHNKLTKKFNEIKIVLNCPKTSSSSPESTKNDSISTPKQQKQNQIKSTKIVSPKSSNSKNVNADKKKWKKLSIAQNECVSIPQTLTYSDIVKNDQNRKSSSEQKQTKKSTFTADQFSKSISSYSTQLHCKKLSCKFLEKDLNKYIPECIIRGSITYIKDYDNLEFSIVDINDPNFKIISIDNGLQLRQYVDLPPENEVFGLVSKDIVVRAIRKSVKTTLNFDVRNKCTVEVLLIDYGDVINIDMDCVMYHLLPEQKKIPAQAINCKLNGIADRSMTHLDLTTRLIELLYSTATFIVDYKNDNVLYVTLIMENDEHLNGRILQKRFSKLNPFLNDDIEPIIDKTKNPALKYPNTNPFAEPADLENSKSKSTITIKNLPNGLTEEELEILFEDNPTTSNALAATLGYNTKDEKLLCQFYDQKTESCFKGINCKKKHIPKNKECWTKDTLADTENLCREIDLMIYKTNTIINVTPTYVANLNCFYAQIKDDKFSAKVPQIWKSTEVKQWDLTEMLPKIQSLVLAKFEDGFFYRAKVLEYNAIRKIFTLFFVDYGNEQKCSLKDLAHCNKSTSKVPYQAELIHIYGIEEIPTDRELFLEARKILCNEILNEKFDVIVQSHLEDLKVKFIDEHHKMTIQRLIDMGCIKRINEEL